MSIPIGGTTAAGFDGVVDAFRRNFSEHGDVGAAVAVWGADGSIVDLWGGEARPGAPWTADTMATVFSTTKGVTSLVIQLLTDQGILDVDATVASYWPEFAQAGKEAITIRQVMSHSAGVLSFPDYIELTAEDALPSAEDIAGRIAAAQPYWEPGTQHGYHAMTFGWILGEVVLRATGRTLGAVFRSELGEPFDLDFWIGLPDTEAHRVADLIDSPPPTDPMVAAYLSLFNPGTWTGQSHFSTDNGVLEVADRFNHPRTRRMEIPAAGGIGTARSLARMFAILANDGVLDGNRVFSSRSIDAHTDEQTSGHDRVLLIENRFALGYSLPSMFNAYGDLPEAFGHSGLGGSVAFADPSRRIGFAYVPNQLLFPRPLEPTRASRLVEAVVMAIG